MAKEADEEKTSKNESGEEESATEENSQEDMVPKKDFQSAVEQKKHFREKYEELQEKIENMTKEEKEEATSMERKESESDADFKQKVEFRLSNPQYTDKDVEFINKFRGENETFSEAAQKEEVQDYLKFREKQEEEEKKTPEPSSPSTPGGEDIDYSDEESFKKAEKKARQGSESGV